MYAHVCWSMIAYRIARRHCGPIPNPDVYTNEALDAWISATARNEADGVKRLHEVLVRQGRLQRD